MRLSVSALRKVHFGVLFFSLPMLFCILHTSIHLFENYSFYIMCINILIVCMYTYSNHVWYLQKPEEGTLDSLELELQIVINHHVSARKWTQVLSTKSKCSNHWTISHAQPIHLFLICNWGQRREEKNNSPSFCSQREASGPTPHPLWNVLLLLMKELQIWVILKGLWVT